MSKNSIQTISVRDFGGSKLRMVTMHPRTNRMEYLNTDKDIRPRRIDRIDAGRVFEQVENWLGTASPDDVTYYGSFRSLVQYAAWRGELLCESQDVQWDITVEYTSGEIASYVSTALNRPLPQVFADVFASAEQAEGGAA